MSKRGEAISLMIPAHRFGEALRFYGEGLDLESSRVADGTGARAFLIGDQEIWLVPTQAPLLQSFTGVRFHVHRLRDFIVHLVEDGHLRREILEGLDASTADLEISDPGGNKILISEERH